MGTGTSLGSVSGGLTLLQPFIAGQQHRLLFWQCYPESRFEYCAILHSGSHFANTLAGYPRRIVFENQWDEAESNARSAGIPLPWNDLDVVVRGWCGRSVCPLLFQ